MSNVLTNEVIEKHVYNSNVNSDDPTNDTLVEEPTIPEVEPTKLNYLAKLVDNNDKDAKVKHDEEVVEETNYASYPTNLNYSFVAKTIEVENEKEEPIEEKTVAETKQEDTM